MAKCLKKSTDNPLDEIITMLDGIQKQCADDCHKLERRLTTVEESMDFITRQYESQQKMSENLIKHDSELEFEDKELRKKIAMLENSMTSLSMEVDLEQYGQRDCIENTGVPQQQDEDAQKIAINSSKYLSTDVSSKNIQGRHCINLKRNSTIICTFTNRRITEIFKKNS